MGFADAVAGGGLVLGGGVGLGGGGLVAELLGTLTAGGGGSAAV
ncbi:MAG TPA: hypothetical protein VGL93_02205 [Streptosporangiaceae bacterium]